MPSANMVDNLDFWYTFLEVRALIAVKIAVPLLKSNTIDLSYL